MYAAEMARSRRLPRASALAGTAIVLIAVGVALAHGAGTPMTPARGSSRTSCPPPGGHLIAHDRSVRVYRSGAEQPTAMLVAACLVGRSGHMTLLGPPSGCCRGMRRSVAQFKLAGEVLGYVETQFGVDSGTTSLDVVDVASRRVLHSIAAGHYVDAGLIFSEGVSDFLVTARGSVAWIVARSEGRGASTLSVHAAARTGAPAVLDQGSDIGPRSLSLSGGVLSWSRGGTRRSAPMP
jgi:hypothetical protein